MLPNLRPPTSPTSPLLWFAVAGAPLAWVTQFGLGYWISQARCSPAGTMWGIAIDAWAIGATVIAAAVALGAGLTAVSIYRATEDAGSAPPGGRVHFLATVGVAITPLFLLIIVLSGIGVTVLTNCQQS